MKRRLILALISVMVCVVWSGGAQFTEKRIKKGPSMSALKEQCCQLFGEIVGLIPDMLRNMADLQEKSVKSISGYWHGDKESFCSTASRETLAASKVSLEQLKEKMSALSHEIDSCLARLNA